MATVNLGVIKPVFKGAYNNSTAYVLDNIVTSGGSSYICILASQGNAVSNGTYWTQMSAAGTDGTDLTSTLTTAGDILYRDGSGLQRLAKGTAGQSLTMNSGATAPEWGTGFDGTYKLHAFNKYVYNTTVTVGTLAGGSADGQRDCVVINGGNYLTITPAHADDLFEFNGGCSYHIPGNNTYGGLGLMTSTSTDFANNRNFFHRSGQHSIGNGSAGGDEYKFEWLTYANSCSGLGLTAGTTYYVRMIGQKHSANNISFNNSSGGQHEDGRHFLNFKHWKKA
jgi:hypothetical protein